MLIWNRLWPHLLAYLMMMAVAFMLFKPYWLEDKVLAQPDNQRARGMQAELVQYMERDGHSPMWTNSMFSGMPVYMIRHTAVGSLHFHLMRAALWWHSVTIPHYVIWLAMTMAYLGLIIMGVDWRIALLGGISYGISTYNIDLAEAGHSTKMLALAYTPVIWAAALLILRRKWLLGAGLFSVLTSLQILANHFQITYYTFLLLGIGLLIYGYRAIRSKELKPYLLSLGVMAGALALSFASNLSMLWPAYEYSKETIRGTSELRTKAAQGDGLDKEYAFGWSYGIRESMTLLIPHFQGGGASQTFRGTDTYRRVYPNVFGNYIEQGVPRPEAARAAEQQVAALFYHGDQPFVGVAIYFGVALIFLFILGALIADGPLRWWLLSSGLFALMLAWGKNFFLNDLLFDYFPFFNKFRAVSMALGLSHLAVVMLGMLGLQAFFKSQDEVRRRKALIAAGAITGGLVLGGLLIGMAMQMEGRLDEQVGAELAAMLKADRAAILRADALRSLGIAALCFGLLYAYQRGMLRRHLVLALVALVAVADVWLINTRILFPEKFEPARIANAEPSPTRSDLRIMDDNDPHFRVLDLRGNPFTNATTSYFHKSIGGYHAAKLMRYQELIEAYLSNPAESLHILGMLNTKYVISQQDEVMPMAEALGNAWFVDQLEAVPNADVELTVLKELKPADLAITQEGLIPSGWPNDYNRDSAADIRLISYHPDTLSYSYSSKEEAFAVFSEVYYPPSKGWKVYLDGAPYEDFIKVNFLLRGLKLPAGEDRKVEMIFRPASVHEAKKVAFAGSLLGLLLLIGGIVLTLRDGRLPAPEQLPTITSQPAPPSRPVRKKKK
jgi:hypothetical protein